MPHTYVPSAAIPIITASVTLLSSLARGRMGLQAGTYRPHLVVDGDGVVDEHYMGVAFVGGPQALAPGESAEVQLALVYFPNVDYRSLHAGCTFSIREGGTTVGRGTVMLAGALQ